MKSTQAHFISYRIVGLLFIAIWEEEKAKEKYTRGRST